MFKDALQEMLEAELELEIELGYSKEDKKNKNTEKRRNGYLEKTIKTQFWEFPIEVPRDGSFEPIVVPKHKRDISGIEEKVISLYGRGMSTRDIHEQIKDIFGIEISVEMVSKMRDSIIPKFSIFIAQYTDKDNSTNYLKSLKINYVPIGFKLININEGNNMIIYNYATDNEQRFEINLFSSVSKGKSYYDTENVEIEEFVFKESNASLWKTDEMTYLIWSQNGDECHVSGNLDKKEVIKIAENISK